LVLESLRAMLPVTIVLVWLWCVTVIFVVEQAIGVAYVVFAINLLSCALSFRLHTQHLSLAVGVFLAGVFVVVTLIIWALPSPITLCLYVLVVLTTAMLTNARVLGWMTGLCALCVATLGVFTAVGWLAAGTALVLVLLSTLTAWLGSRRLFTALQWTLSMTAESQKNAADAQFHRGELQRVLKNLDEAYVRLEHSNRALLVAREAAEKAYRFKSDFVVNVSHELRTPLNLIIGFSEMMVTAPESYGGALLPQAYRGDIMAIYRSGKHLSDLINDVLDLSQIEAGRMPIHKSPTDLAQVVRESADIVRGLVEARGLACEVALPDKLPLLNLDRTRIRQVLLNLLTNATRFTDQGFVRAAVRVGTGETDEPEAIVSVQDSGRGISPEKLAVAFEAFSQLHESQIRDGSGMGLALSKQFVALHGGRMWIESAVGKGTTVSFTLPIREQPTAQSAMRAMAQPDGTPTVLVLHDDVRALDLLNRYVDGFKFVLIDNAAELGAALQQYSTLAVLVDSVWLQRVQLKLSHVQTLTTAATVCLPLPGMRRLGAQLGAADYLTKPVTRDAVVAALNRLDKPIGKLLIVDNDPHVVRLLARMVKTEWPNVQVYEAFGGNEALAALRAQLPDVVLLDLLMPDVSGYDVIETMRQDEALAEALAPTATIIVSARGEEEENAPIYGDVVLNCREGYSITQLLHMVAAVLNGVKAL
jgi:signal transduction histidine kinase/DNA-binding response OmpR family regulator